MRQNSRFLLLTLLCLWLGIAWAGPQEVILYTHIQGGKAVYAGQLGEVTRKALDSLQKFQVKAVHPLPAANLKWPRWSTSCPWP